MYHKIMHRFIMNVLEKLQFVALYGRVITRSLKLLKSSSVINLFYQQNPVVTIYHFVNHFLVDIFTHFHKSLPYNSVLKPPYTTPPFKPVVHIYSQMEILVTYSLLSLKQHVKRPGIWYLQ